MVVYKRLGVYVLLAAFTFFCNTSARFCKGKNGIRLLRAHKWPKFNLTTCHDVSDYGSHLRSFLRTCQFEADAASKHAPACNQACALDSSCAALVYSEETGCEKCLFGGQSGVSGNERALDGMLVPQTKLERHINGKWLSSSNNSNNIYEWLTCGCTSDLYFGH